MYLDSCVGRTQTGSSSKSSTIAASCSEVDQESSAVLRSQMAAMYVSLFVVDSIAEYCTLLAANMKVITSIYLNCRPDLRDEWLAGTEPDDAADAQVR